MYKIHIKRHLKAMDYAVNFRREVFEMGPTLNLHVSRGTFFKMLHREIEPNWEYWSQWVQETQSRVWDCGSGWGLRRETHSKCLHRICPRSSNRSCVDHVQDSILEGPAENRYRGAESFRDLTVLGISWGSFRLYWRNLDIHIKTCTWDARNTAPTSKIML